MPCCTRPGTRCPSTACTCRGARSMCACAVTILPRCVTWRSRPGAAGSVTTRARISSTSTQAECEGGKKNDRRARLGGAERLIHNIVFDVGRVLVDLQPQPIIDFLSEHGARVENIDALCESVTLEDHECGRLDGGGLLARMAALAERSPALERLQAKWVDMFQLHPPMVNLAHRLSEHYRVYLMSNVGDIHWA